jgi:hypothetical protein
VIPAHRERTALGRRWWVQAVYQRPIEAPCERQSLIGDHRRDADSCEEPRAATRRGDDQHCAEREEGADYDVSFQGADSTTPLNLGAPVRASSLTRSRPGGGVARLGGIEPLAPVQTASC